jgi:AmpD protein
MGSRIVPSRIAMRVPEPEPNAAERPGLQAGRQVGWQAGWWDGAQQRPSSFFNQRPQGVAGQVTLVVVHSISLPPGVYGGSAVEQLFLGCLDPAGDPELEAVAGMEVSAHFFVRRTGEVLQFVSCDDRAWHAGVSVWEGRSGCNDFSIGVEFEGLHGLGFEPVQYAQGGVLLSALSLRYPIQCVAGHEHVAPGRKTDPGPGFAWDALRNAASDEVRRWRWPPVDSSGLGSARYR